MNNKTILLAKNVLVFIILLVGVIFIVQAMGTEVDPDTGEAVGDVFAVAASVDFSLVLVWASIALIGIFTIMAIISNPKRFIPTAIAIGVFGVIVLIGQMTGDPSPIASLDAAGHPDATTENYELSGMAIQTTFVLIGLALILILAQVVRGFVGYFAK